MACSPALAQLHLMSPRVCAGMGPETRDVRPGWQPAAVGMCLAEMASGLAGGHCRGGWKPGSLLFPTMDLPYPYGFGGLNAWLATDELLQRYLAQPLTLFLGTADTQRDEELDIRPDADRQGRNRLERGRNAYHAAVDLAARRGWPLAWRLVQADGVGHDHHAVFDRPACRYAVLGRGGADDSASAPGRPR